MIRTIDYNRKTGLFDAALDGIVIASGSSYLAAEEGRKYYLLQIIAKIITMMNFEPTPPAAPVALPKPTKKTKKAKDDCICPSCRIIDPNDPTIYPNNGIFYCTAGREWAVYDEGHFVGFFPKKERLEAQDAFNNARYERLRRKAA